MANQGLYHPTYNPNGSKKASDGNFWYNTAVSFTSISDCFDPAKLLTASGYIGTVSGRPDGLFYDQVHEGDITDLRMSSQKVEDYNRLIDREFNKLVAGTYRGSEGEWSVTQTISMSATYSSSINAFTTSSLAFPFTLEGLVGSGSGAGLGVVLPSTFTGAPCILVDSANTTRRGLIFVTSGNTFIRVNGSFASGTITVAILSQTTRTKSNTLTYTDIIGAPANYPTVWKQSGVSGVPLVVAEDGTSMLPTGALTTFKLSRKANATPLQVLKSTDSGATWTALAVTTHYTFSTTTNAITFTAGNIPLATDLVMVTYQTHTNMAVPGVNTDVLAVGDVVANNVNYSGRGGLLAQLINKVATGSASPYNAQTPLFKVINYVKTLDTASGVQTHNSLTLTNIASPSVKVFPYLTRANEKARLQLVFKEMKYSTANADWGDDSTFNIVDNVSTTTDWYGSTVLIGQKYVELPYFISAGE